MNGLSAMNASGGGGGERLAPNTQAGESRASEPWQAGQGGYFEAGKISLKIRLTCVFWSDIYADMETAMAITATGNSAHLQRRLLCF